MIHNNPVESIPSFPIEFVSCGLLGGPHTFVFATEPKRRIGKGDKIDLEYSTNDGRSRTYHIQVDKIRLIDVAKVEFIVVVREEYRRPESQTYHFLDVNRSTAHLRPRPVIAYLLFRPWTGRCIADVIADEPMMTPSSTSFENAIRIDQVTVETRATWTSL